jgi:hypothetical protein
MSHDRILTALYPDQSSAERAAERLRAIGVPEEHIEMHRSEEGDVAPGQHPTGDGLFGAFAGLLVPESDLRSYEHGLGRGCTVLIASQVPRDRARDAHAALDEGALEIDDERDRSADLGAAGGFRQAAGETEGLAERGADTADRPWRSRGYDPR